MAPISGFGPTFFRKADFLLRYPITLPYNNKKKQNSKNEKTKRPRIGFPGSRSGLVPIVGTEKPSVYWGFGLCVGNGVGNEGIPEAEQDLPPPLIKLACAALPAPAERIAIGSCDRPIPCAQDIVNREQAAGNPAICPVSAPEIVAEHGFCALRELAAGYVISGAAQDVIRCIHMNRSSSRGRAGIPAAVVFLCNFPIYGTTSHFVIKRY